MRVNYFDKSQASYKCNCDGDGATLLLRSQQLCAHRLAVRNALPLRQSGVGN